MQHLIVPPSGRVRSSRLAKLVELIPIQLEPSDE